MSKEKQKMTLSDLCLLYELPVLFIDDDKGFAKELYKQARDFHFELTHVGSLEEGMDFLRTDQGKSIRCVILDILCVKKKDDKGEDKSFFAAASEYFHKTFPHLPIVGLTGHAEQYETHVESHKGVIQIFSKGDNVKEMFEHLRDKALDCEKVKIRFTYQDIFDTVDKYFLRGAEERLVHCLQKMDSDDMTTKTDTLGNLRKLEEGFYIALNKLDKGMVPDELIFDKNGNPRVVNEKIVRHLNGNYDVDKKKTTTTEYIEHNSHMDRFIYLVFKLCSGEIHETAQKTSRYTVQAAVNAFLDMVLWLRRLGQSKP